MLDIVLGTGGQGVIVVNKTSMVLAFLKLTFIPHSIIVCMRVLILGGYYNKYIIDSVA